MCQDELLGSREMVVCQRQGWSPAPTAGSAGLPQSHAPSVPALVFERGPGRQVAMVGVAACQ